MLLQLSYCYFSVSMLFNRYQSLHPVEVHVSTRCARVRYNSTASVYPNYWVIVNVAKKWSLRWLHKVLSRRKKESNVHALLSQSGNSPFILKYTDSFHLFVKHACNTNKMHMHDTKSGLRFNFRVFIFKN